MAGGYGFGINPATGIPWGQVDTGLVDNTPIVKDPFIQDPWVIGPAPPDEELRTRFPGDPYTGDDGTEYPATSGNFNIIPNLSSPRGYDLVPFSSGGAVSSNNTPTDSVTPQNAKNTINAVLDTYGLGSLSSYLYDVYARQEVNIRNPDALIYAIKDQPAYQTRFAGNASRRKKGLAELSPGTYVGMEDAYHQLLQANGLPAGFYDNIEDFQKMIENDMSPRELQDRIQLGFNEVDRADPAVLKQIQLLYPEAGIGDSRESLAAFFLDPVKAAPLLARRAQAAKIGARSFEAGFGQLDASTAEGLASRGYSDSQVQSVFSDLGTQAGLLNEMQGEAKLSADEKLGSAFGYDSAAKVKLERRRATRKAIFSDGGRFTSTSGATSGTQQNALGSAN